MRPALHVAAHGAPAENTTRQDRRAHAKMNISTCGLVAMTSASHAEGRQFDPGQVYFTTGLSMLKGAAFHSMV